MPQNLVAFSLIGFFPLAIRFIRLIPILLPLLNAILALSEWHLLPSLYLSRVKAIIILDIATLPALHHGSFLIKEENGGVGGVLCYGHESKSSHAVAIGD
jgi:hypothetical protein